MLDRVRGSDGGISPIMAVGFADMVGFTVLSQHLGDDELAAVVSRFEELAHDTVVALGGRVVKMIGDEVMFVVQTATGAAEIGLSLAEAYADDELLSDVRVGLAIGPVLVQDGDFYGPVVNLASRLVGVANPGTVLVSASSAYRPRGRGWPGVRHQGAPAPDPEGHRPGPAWKLSRPGSEPGADRRRSVRWERLGEVLRELDELRDRGEQVVRGAVGDPGRPVRRRSTPVQIPSSRAVAIPWPRRSKCPSKGATGRPRRSTSQPDRPGISTEVGVAPRVEHPNLDASGLAPDGGDLGAAHGQLGAAVGPAAPSEGSRGDQRDQDVVGQPVRIDRRRRSIA